jgi:hypothetical protein
MKGRILAVFFGASLLFSGVVAAQSSGVLFTVPLNLTQLSPGLFKVRVMCQVGSKTPNNNNLYNTVYAASRPIEVPPDGRVVTTATVWVRDATPSHPFYECHLLGLPLLPTEPTDVDWYYLRGQTGYLRLSPDPPVMSGAVGW